MITGVTIHIPQDTFDRWGLNDEDAIEQYSDDSEVVDIAWADISDLLDGATWTVERSEGNDD